MSHPTSSVLAAVLLAVLTAGCRKELSVERPIVLVVSGDTGGWIVPCGCAANQSGGLMRRGALLDQAAADGELIYVDAGGAIAGESPYDVAKFEAIVRGEIAMQVRAHNIGAGEAKLGAKSLQRIADQLKLPLVSCNVRDDAGDFIAAPLRICEAAGRRIAVTGVLSDGQTIDGVRIDPPRAAVLQIVSEHAGEYDALVVLAYLPETELRRLAAELPEADLVVGGPTGQSIAPERLGPTLLAAATNKGKFVAKFTAQPPPAPLTWQGEVVELVDTFADDPRQLENLHTFYEVLAARDFAPHETSFAAHPIAGAGGSEVAGTSQCRACHAADCTTWDASKHAHAWQSLETTGAQVDAYCQQCHTTGYGLAGGFISAGRTPQRVEIGCESCHGPSRTHAENPAVRTPQAGRAAETCVMCHDRENSPHFAYDVYWPRISHGDEAAK